APRRPLGFFWASITRRTALWRSSSGYFFGAAMVLILSRTQHPPLNPGRFILKENLAFTAEDSPLANLMLSVMGAFAEFERALIGERQREGITLAKTRGVYRGRAKALSPEKANDLRTRAAVGEQKASLAREFGISRETLYQYLRTEEQISAQSSA
ncbi:recombinase family protein, partial [Paenarthrobacter sp. Z7-10]|nr:recombinase family protein [Paenarthrobacter sp. Z7-10]